MFLAFSGGLRLGLPVGSLSLGVASMRPGVRGVSSLVEEGAELLRLGSVGELEEAFGETLLLELGLLVPLLVEPLEPLVVGRCV